MAPTFCACGLSLSVLVVVSSGVISGASPAAEAETPLGALNAYNRAMLASDEKTMLGRVHAESDDIDLRAGPLLEFGVELFLLVREAGAFHAGGFCIRHINLPRIIPERPAGRFIKMPQRQRFGIDNKWFRRSRINLADAATETHLVDQTFATN